MPEYSAQVWGRGKTVASVRLELNKLLGIQLLLHWSNPEENFTWSVEQRGTKEEIAKFLEEWVPKCPDQMLMEKALEDLNAQLPEGML
jgi:hypothetical protein